MGNKVVLIRIRGEIRVVASRGSHFMGLKAANAESVDDLFLKVQDSRLLESYFAEVIRQFGSPDRDAPAKMLCPVRPEVAARVGLKDPITVFGLKFVVYSSKSR